ncbi:MAG: ATP phosphoribosyltransferase regulatory subunit [Sorangiineae bacterium]|nr:ATP phosphoribosyltransferase regulatory subunit [Polyangiaceae bacterium]MEB2325019.1 ATP phosphoribosyltransferase regulatory subunit [Sorangiineae bacterium]
MSLSPGVPEPSDSPADRSAGGAGGLEHPLPAGMRDFLPTEARRQAALVRRVIASFELFGYERVSVPAFEYAEVLEKGLGALEPEDVLRFVEPETGQVVALRPDMTPQIARLTATRLGRAPGPARLCYEGSVLRRRRERARRHRQIPQAGIELVGLAAPEGDLEVLEVASAAVRAAGLGEFVVDLGHTGVASALLAGAAPPARAVLVEALSLKDGATLVRQAERAGLARDEVRALAALPELHGGVEVWERALAALSATPAAAASAELHALYRAADSLGLAPRLTVDLGEPRGFAYYTGVTFQLLAAGPGQPVGSGGRYDGLLARFGAPRPAAGFGLDLDNLAWALAHAGVAAPPPPRVLVSGEGALPLLAALRARGLACAPAPSGADAEGYASAWSFSYRLALDGAGARLLSNGRGEWVELTAASPAELATRVAERIEHEARR